MTAVPERLVESVLPHEVARLLLSEAHRAVPDEACGLLVGRIDSGQVSITRAIPCENTAPPHRRTHRFAIDPRRLIQEERNLRGSDLDVVGFYHSHPVGPGVPSTVDRTFMELWPDVVWLIVEEASDLEGASVRAWAFDVAGSGTFRELRLTEAATSTLPPERTDGGIATNPGKSELLSS